MIVETEAVVLHAMDYGDTSKIVTLYTKKFGKIKVIAKGVRSQKNKFGSSLEPMTVSSVVLYKKEHKDLHLLSKSEIAVSLSKIQNDTDRLYTALALIELINMIMHDEEENAAIYSLILQALRTIDVSARNHINVFFSFLLKMFDQFGFGIRFDRCIVCQKEMQASAEPFASIRLSDGKIICSGCSNTGHMNGVKIDGGLLKSLYYLQSTAITNATVLSISAAMKDEIIATLQSYLRYHIENARTLKSLSLLYTTSH